MSVAARSHPSAAAVDVILRDGSTLRLRAPAQDDAGALTAFFSGLSERSFYQRFHGLRTIDDDLVAHFLDPDWGDRGVLVGTLVGADGNDRIVAIGEYDRLRDPPPRRRRSRLRTSSRVAGSARACSSGSQRLRAEQGIERFVAEVLPDNRAMLGVFAGRRSRGDARAGRRRVRGPLPDRRPPSSTARASTSATTSP